MPMYRCWLYFGMGKPGWKESFYRAANDQAECLGALQRLAIARAGLLGFNAAIIHLRVSNEPPDRSVLCSGGPAASVATSCLPPYAAILVRLEGANATGYHRMVALRGIPATYTAGPSLRQMQLLPTGAAALQAFIDELRQNGWCLKDNNTRSPAYRIIDMQPQNPTSMPLDPTGFFVVTTEGTHAITPYDPDHSPAYATVRGIQWSPRLEKGYDTNGIHQILAVGPTEIVLAGNPPPSGAYIGGGLIQARGPVYTPIARGTPERMVCHRTGLAAAWGSPATLPAEEIRRLALPPVPPTPGWLPEPKPPGPVPTSPLPLLANMHDVATLIFSGYPSDVDTISLAPITNLPGYWLVAVPGTNADNEANWFAAISSAYNYPTDFLQTLGNGIISRVPPRSKLILAGHSQGGMVSQNVASYLKEQRLEVARLLLIGTPYTFTPHFEIPGRAWRAAYDPVPYLAAISPEPTPPTLAIPGYRAQVQIQSYQPAWNVVAVHNSYASTPDLLDYDAAGVHEGESDYGTFFTLGPIQRFKGPPLPKTAP